MTDTVKVIPNVEAGQNPPAHVLKSDNSLYTYRMYFDGYSRIAYADDLEALCTVLIPGYDEMSKEEQLSSRLRHLLVVQAQLRASIMNSVLGKETNLEDWELDILKSSDSSPSGWGGDEEDSIDFWSARVPLVLLEADYAPYTDLPQPVSGLADVKNPPNIIWLRGNTVEDFFKSLQRAGQIDLSKTRNRD